MASGNNNSNLPPISFDGEGRVRVLDPEKFKATEELEKDARGFVGKVHDFTTTVRGIVDDLSKHAVRIEKEKLKAIGQRNLVDSERELRKRKQREYQALIDERMAELQRLTNEYDSLCRMEQRQRQLLEKLANNEGGRDI